MDLLDEMPQGAHWRAAQDNDPLSALRLNENDLSLEDFTPPLAGWTTETELLAGIHDNTQITAGKYIKDFNFKPFPRPKNPLADAVGRLRTKMKKKKAQADIDYFNRRYAPHLAQSSAEAKDARQ